MAPDDLREDDGLANEALTAEPTPWAAHAKWHRSEGFEMGLLTDDEDEETP